MEAPSIVNAQAASQLQSHSHREILDAIDKLRRETADPGLSLPQVVVCGDQSSGKSSVLEAIAQVKFPVGNDCTTKFPTEVVLRNTKEAKVAVRLHAAHGSNSKRKHHVESFAPTTKLEQSRDLAAIVKEASDYLLQHEPNLKFWSDWLRIEISGPHQPHLTLVDLPGLIQVGDPSDCQGIIELIRTTGTARARTIGVLTKPDRLDPGTDQEAAALRLLSNESFDVGLGWHVLKNSRHEDNVSPEQRDSDEQRFFADSTWASYGWENLGISTLREKLSGHLFARITDDLPRLIDEMEKRLANCEMRRKQMGEARHTLREQRAYLSHIQRELQRLVEAALDGDYEKAEFEAFFDGAQGKGLRDMINVNSDAFAESIANGKQYDIRVESKVVAPVNFFPPYTPKVSTEYKPTTISFEEYCKELARFMESTRGKNLRCTLTTDTVKAVFRQQSAFWAFHARQYMAACFANTFLFLQAAVMHVAGQHTGKKLVSHFLDLRFKEKDRQLKDKVSELLWPYQRCHPITYSPAYKSSMAKIRPFVTDDESDTTSQSGECFSWRSQALQSNLKANLVSAAKAMDEADIYYNIALDTFVDNVAILGVEAKLLTDLPNILTAEDIAGLDADEVTAIASEPPEAQKERQRLHAQCEALQDTVATCRMHGGQSTSFISPKTSSKPQATTNSFAQWPNQQQKSNFSAPSPGLFGSTGKKSSGSGSGSGNFFSSGNSNADNELNSNGIKNTGLFGTPPSTRLFAAATPGAPAPSHGIFGGYPQKPQTATNGTGGWQNIPFREVPTPVGGVDEFQSLVAHERFIASSPEELRLDDYNAGRKMAGSAY